MFNQAIISLLVGTADCDLMSLVENYVPFFKNSNKKKKLDILLNGVNIDKEEFLKTNTILTKAVQNFILSSRRFSVVETID